MRRNNGFTLIELLATILILAAIALVTFPVLLNSIKDSEKQMDKNVEKLINNATNLYIDENSNNYVKTEKNTYCIPINTLIESGKLKKEFVDSSEEDIMNYNVEIKYIEESDDFSYNITDTCQESYVCNFSNDVDNDKQFDIGDEVTCGTESFYVISNNNNEVIEMLSKYRIDLESGIQNTKVETSDNVVNFSSSVYWIDLAGNYLNKYTKGKADSKGRSYYYIFDINEAKKINHEGTVIHYVYKYEEKLKEMGIVSATTKLMSYEQALGLGCIRNEETTGTCKSAPDWVWNTSYWLGSSTITNYTYEGVKYRIWSIDADKSFDLPVYQETHGGYHGVRPVVKIYTSEINID